MNPTSNQGAIAVITTTIAIMAVLCVISVCTLSFYHIEVPKDLNMLASALVGALTAMLVKTSPTETQNQPRTPSPDSPAPVEVVNKPDAPVPTVEAQ